MTNKLKLSVRLISWVTAIIFSTSSIAQAAPVSFPEPVASAIVTPIPVPPFLSLPPIELAPELGRVEQLLSSSSKSAQTPFVYLIQDAHESLDAQENIRRIVNTLIEKEKVSVVCFEGGSLELDRSFYDFAHNSSANEKIWNALFSRGQIGGLERAALESSTNTRFLGLEDEKVYFDNVHKIQKIFADEDQSREVLTQIDHVFSELAGRLLSGDVKKIRDEKRAFERKQLDLNQYAKELLRHHDSRQLSQNDWPQLARLLKLQELEIQLSKNDAAIQKELGTIRKKSSKSPVGFVWDPAQHARIKGRLRWYFERAVDQGFNPEKYPHLKDWISYYVLQDELASSALFEEINRFEKQLLNAAKLSHQAQDFLTLEEDYALVRNLISLELTREDWQSIKSRNVDLKSLAKRLVKLYQTTFHKSPEINFWKALALIGLFNTAKENYTIVETRDQILSKKLLDRLATMKTGKVAVLTGGFHTRKIAALLRKQHIDFAVISPTIYDINRKLDYRARITLKSSAITNAVYQQTALAIAGSLGSQDAKPFKEMLKLEAREALTTMSGIRRESLKAPIDKAESRVQPASGSSLGRDKNYFDVIINGVKVNLIDAMIAGTFQMGWIKFFVPEPLPVVDLSKEKPFVSMSEACRIVKKSNGRNIQVKTIRNLVKVGKIKTDEFGRISTADLQQFLNTRGSVETAKLLNVWRQGVEKVSIRHGAKHIGRQWFIPNEWIEKIRQEQHGQVPLILLAQELGMSYRTLKKHVRNPRKYFGANELRKQFGERNQLFEDSPFQVLRPGYENNLTVNLIIAWQLVQIFRKSRQVLSDWDTGQSLAEKSGITPKTLSAAINRGEVQTEKFKVLSGKAAHHRISPEESLRVQTQYKNMLEIYKKEVEPFTDKEINTWDDLNEAVKDWDTTAKFRDRFGFRSNQAVLMLLQRGIRVKGVNIITPFANIGHWYVPPAEVKRITEENAKQFKEIVAFVNKYNAPENPITNVAELETAVKDWYTARMLKERSGRKKATILESIKKGKLAGIRIDLVGAEQLLRGYFIPPQEAEKWLRERMSSPKKKVPSENISAQASSLGSDEEIKKQIAKLDIDLTVRNYQAPNADMIKEAFRNALYVISQIDVGKTPAAVALKIEMGRLLHQGKAVLVIDRMQSDSVPSDAYPYLGEFGAERGDFILMAHGPFHRTEQIPAPAWLLDFLKGLVGISSVPEPLKPDVENNLVAQSSFTQFPDWKSANLRPLKVDKENPDIDDFRVFFEDESGDTPPGGLSKASSLGSDGEFSGDDGDEKEYEPKLREMEGYIRADCDSRKFWKALQELKQMEDFLRVHGVNMHPEHYLTRGQICMNLGAWKPAVKALTDSIRGYSSGSISAEEAKSKMKDAYFERGLAYSELGDYSNAISDFQNALMSAGNEDQITEAKGIAHLRHREWTNALRDLGFAARRHNEERTLRALLGLAYAYREAHMGNDEKRILKKAAEEFPESPKINFYKALMLYQQSYLKYALQNLDLSLQKLGKGEGAPVFLLKGYIHLNLNQLDEAEAAFRQVVHLDPSNDEARLQLAGILFARNDWERANRELEEATFLLKTRLNEAMVTNVCENKDRRKQQALKFGFPYLWEEDAGFVVSEESHQDAHEVLKEEFQKIIQLDKRLNAIDERMKQEGDANSLLLLRAETLWELHEEKSKIPGKRSLFLLIRAESDYHTVLVREPQNIEAQEGLRKISQKLALLKKKSAGDSEEEKSEGKSLGAKGWASGDIIGGHFRIVKTLAVGGYGVLLLADQLTSDRAKVVQRIVLKQLARDRRDKSGILREEAKFMSHLGAHENIPKVYDYEGDENDKFIVMEHIEGESLADILEEHPAGATRGQIQQVIPLAQALEFVHKNGVTHQDVKPANVMIRQNDGRPFLIDFGIASQIGSGSDLAQSHTLTTALAGGGTLAYMAPEQIRGETPARTVDVWAFGVMLYEIASGELPFQAKGRKKLEQVIQEDAPESPSAVAARHGLPPVPADLEKLILSMLAKNQKKRVRSMAEVARALEKILPELPEGEKPVVAPAQNAEPIVGRWESIRNTITGWVGSLSFPRKRESSVVNEESDDSEIPEDESPAEEVQRIIADIAKELASSEIANSHSAQYDLRRERFRVAAEALERGYASPELTRYIPEDMEYLFGANENPDANLLCDRAKVYAYGERPDYPNAVGDLTKALRDKAADQSVIRPLRAEMALMDALNQPEGMMRNQGLGWAEIDCGYQPDKLQSAFVLDVLSAVKNLKPQKTRELLRRVKKVRAVELPDFLFDKLCHREKKFRETAATLLGNLTAERLLNTNEVVERLVALLSSQNEGKRDSVVMALGLIGEAAYPACLQLVDREASVPAAEAIGQMGAVAIFPLIQNLKNPDAKQRDLKLDILGTTVIHFGAKEGLKSAVQTLIDNAKTSQSAIRQLGTIGAYLKKNSGDPDVLNQIVDALTRLADSDADIQIRLSAAESLVLIEGEKFYRKLAELEFAAEGKSFKDERETIVALINLVTWREYMDREIALRILAKIISLADAETVLRAEKELASRKSSTREAIKLESLILARKKELGIENAKPEESRKPKVVPVNPDAEFAAKMLLAEVSRRERERSGDAEKAPIVREIEAAITSESARLRAKAEPSQMNPEPVVEKKVAEPVLEAKPSEPIVIVPEPVVVAPEPAPAAEPPRTVRPPIPINGEGRNEENPGEESSLVEAESLGQAAFSHEIWDAGQREAMRLGINPRLVARGLIFDESFVPGLSNTEHGSWWTQGHLAGNELTHAWVQAGQSVGERHYFAGRDVTGDELLGYKFHQIMHDVFLATLSQEQQAAFQVLVEGIRDRLFAMRLEPGERFPMGLDAPLPDDPATRAINLSEMFAQLAAAYFKQKLSPRWMHELDNPHYVAPEIFVPYFDQLRILCTASSLGGSNFKVDYGNSMDSVNELNRITGFVSELLRSYFPQVYAQMISEAESGDKSAKDASSFTHLVTVVVTKDYFIHNGQALIQSLLPKDEIFVLFKLQPDPAFLTRFEKLANARGVRLTAVQKSMLNRVLGDRKNIFSLEFLTHDAMTVPPLRREMFRFKWDNSALSQGINKQEALAELRKFFLVTDIQDRKSLLHREGIVETAGFWCLDRHFLALIEKLAEIAQTNKALQRAA